MGGTPGPFLSFTTQKGHSRPGVQEGDYITFADSRGDPSGLKHLVQFWDRKYSEGSGDRLTKIEDAWEWQFQELGPVLEVEHTARYASVSIKNPMYEYGDNSGPEFLWIHMWTWEDPEGKWNGTSTWTIVTEATQRSKKERRTASPPPRGRGDRQQDQRDRRDTAAGAATRSRTPREDALPTWGWNAPVQGERHGQHRRDQGRGDRWERQDQPRGGRRG